MNPKRLILGIVAVFVGVWVTDFLIHGLWLQSSYKATMSLWRPEADMQKHMLWLFLGQFLFAVAFVMIWARGFSGNAHVRCGVLYGLFMGLFSQANTFITFAVQPLPRDIAIKWVLSGLVQGVLLGLLVLFVYKPKPEGQAATAAASTANPA
jgi:TRAP-type mannitol/chloroaromatic compound transport system permease small subunit